MLSRAPSGSTAWVSGYVSPPVLLQEDFTMSQLLHQSPAGVLESQGKPGTAPAAAANGNSPPRRFGKVIFNPLEQVPAAATQAHAGRGQSRLWTRGLRAVCAIRACHNSDPGHAPGAAPAIREAAQHGQLRLPDSCPHQARSHASSHVEKSDVHMLSGCSEVAGCTLARVALRLSTWSSA